MREPMPHDYLVLLGIIAVVAGFLFSVHYIAGLVASIVWLVSVILVSTRYR